ncbi:MAG TPA: RebB family R body protein [Rhizomicrobium sp.]|jgi:hypothetical protein
MAEKSKRSRKTQEARNRDEDSRQESDPPPNEKRRRRAEEPPPRQSAGDSLNQAMAGLAGLYTQAGIEGGVSPAVTDALTQALLLVVGSGPSVAAYESLMNVTQANGQMFANSVANQQQTNVLGMAMTAKCVRYMLDPFAADPSEEFIFEEEKR